MKYQFDNQTSQILEIGPINIALLKKKFENVNFKSSLFLIESNQYNIMLTTQQVLEEKNIPLI